MGVWECGNQNNFFFFFKKLFFTLAHQKNSKTFLKINFK